MIFKRKITGFSCDDLKSAMFQAHGKTYPEYFSTSTACLNILAARVYIDPSICKNISGSRKSKLIGNAFQNMQRKEKCVKSLSAFKSLLDERSSKSILGPSTSMKEDDLVQPITPWFKGKFHLAPELAMQTISNIELRPSHAILDSGCMKHFVTAHMRDLLSSKRTSKIRMLLE